MDEPAGEGDEFARGGSVPPKEERGAGDSLFAFVVGPSELVDSDGDGVSDRAF